MKNLKITDGPYQVTRISLNVKTETTNKEGVFKGSPCRILDPYKMSSELGNNFIKSIRIN